MKTLNKFKLNSQGFPLPLKTNCFKCSKSFLVKFVISRQAYSKKNNWEYLTNPQKQSFSSKDRQICNPCLLNFYYDKKTYLATIKDLKKRHRIRKYIYEGKYEKPKDLTSYRPLEPFKLEKISKPQPLLAPCFKCSKSFLVKFVISRQAYSKKNNWSYWTGETKAQKICNACLRSLYYDKLTYWKAVKDSKKRALFRVYLHGGQFN